MQSPPPSLPAGEIPSLLQSYFKAFFNNPLHSDVVFIFPNDLVRSDEQAYASKTFLSDRCPRFFETFSLDMLTHSFENHRPLVVEFGDIFSHAIVYSLDELPKPLTSEQFLESYKQWDETLEAAGERNICDPVEMYHLAKKLGLVALEEVALSAIPHCLRPESAFDVLFSPPSILHKELRSEIVKYIMVNWRDVVQSPAYLYKELNTLPYLTRYHSVIPNDYSMSSSQQHAGVVEINALLAHNLLPNWLGPENPHVNTEGNMPATTSVIPTAIVGEAFSEAGIGPARCHRTPLRSYSFEESAAGPLVEEKLEVVDEFHSLGGKKKKKRLQSCEIGY
ncbi:hypothetical protein BT69DRAFT_1403831 [Atractiella rhizophila]|nr:hypothetical protein BT69DRAFT_1403831 [Atractiella rhizophila]